jgi:protein associated with RNAse G/E
VLDQTTNNKNGAEYAIESWKSNGTQHQLWSFQRVIFPTMYWLMNTNTKLVLQLESGTDTAFLNTRAKLPERKQLWYLEETKDFQDYYTIRNVEYEDKVVDLSGADGSTILGWTATGEDNQRWRLTDIDFNG